MKRGQVYKCNVCGNIVQLLYVGGGDLFCCDQKMELLVEKTADVGAEKHVPVIEKTSNGITVKVGTIPHPMEEAHFIEWISIEVDNKIYTQFLKPGNQPEAEFKVERENIIARAYCNIHGLWKSR
jgi:superoxide reductase